MTDAGEVPYARRAKGIDSTWAGRDMPKCKHHEICGRDADESAGDGLCILHSRNPDKDETAFDKALAEHRNPDGPNKANKDNFSYFVFPGEADFKSTVFDGKAEFRGTVFRKVADFRCCTFGDDVTFEEAEFNDYAYFGKERIIEGDFTAASWCDGDLVGAKFSLRAKFRNTRFKSKAFFGYANFQEAADFSSVNFGADTSFRHAKFNSADFMNAKFHGQAFFPRAKFGRGADPGKANFVRARFLGNSSFGGTRFHGEADFGEVFFQSEAYFGNEAFFVKNTWFRKAEFKGDAYFVDAQFHAQASFVHAAFHGEALFGEAEFHEPLDFKYSTFDRNASFEDANVNSDVVFESATFKDRASFSRATFGGGSFFTNSTFGQDANFAETTFTGEVSFERAVFKEGGNFDSTEFTTETSFQGARFRGRTVFLPRKENGAIVRVFSGVEVDFRWVTLEPLDVLVMPDADLSKCQFLGTDLRKAQFIGASWPKTHTSFPFYGKRSAVYDEIAPKDASSSWQIPHVESLYRELKQNYEDRRDFDRAGDFHFGEKEMRRSNKRETPRQRRILLWFYRWASAYGERSLPPFLWFVFLALLTTVAYLSSGVVGEKCQNPPCPLHWSYANFWDVFLYSLRVMLLLRPAEFDCIGPLGRFLNTVQSVLGPLLVGLFGLAVRQRLKR